MFKTFTLYGYRASSEYMCTDKKENQSFLIYKEIQMGSGAKSYMTNGLLIYLIPSEFPYCSFLFYQCAMSHPPN